MWEIAADFSAEMDFRQNIHKDRWMRGLYYILNTFLYFHFLSNISLEFCSSRFFFRLTKFWQVGSSFNTETNPIICSQFLWLVSPSALRINLSNMKQNISNFYSSKLWQKVIILKFSSILDGLTSSWNKSLSQCIQMTPKISTVCSSKWGQSLYFDSLIVWRNKYLVKI